MIEKEMKTAYECGWTAYNCGLPYDLCQSQEWRNGWIAAEALDHGQPLAADEEAVS